MYGTSYNTEKCDLGRWTFDKWILDFQDVAMGLERKPARTFYNGLHPPAGLTITSLHYNYYYCYYFHFGGLAM